MKEHLKPLGLGAVGMALVLALYLAYGWVSLRYTEFVVMRAVTIAVACQNPTEAGKLGIACGAPPPPAAAPPAPVSAPTKPPG